MTRLEQANEKYPPGTKIKSLFEHDNGAVFTVLGGFENSLGNILAYVAEGGRKYVYFKGEWSDIIPIEKEPEAENPLYKDSVWSEFKPGDDAIKHDISMPEEGEKLIRRFETGAVRSDATGRPRPDWVSSYAIEAISMRMVGAQNEFGEANYLLGIPEFKCLESLCRHVEELKEALLILKDPKIAKDVAAAAGFNITAMLHTMVLKEKGLYKKVYDKEEELITVSEAKKGANFTDKV